MKPSAERVVKDIHSQTRKPYSAEEKIRIVLEGLRGDDTIVELCRREGITQGVYYKRSKHFMEAGKKRLGKNLRAQRTAKDWSQEELSFEAGIHRIYFSDLARGAQSNHCPD